MCATKLFYNTLGPLFCIDVDWLSKELVKHMLDRTTQTSQLCTNIVIFRQKFGLHSNAKIDG